MCASARCVLCVWADIWIVWRPQGKQLIVMNVNRHLLLWGLCCCLSHDPKTKRTLLTAPRTATARGNDPRFKNDQPNYTSIQRSVLACIAFIFNSYNSIQSALNKISILTMDQMSQWLVWFSGSQFLRSWFRLGALMNLVSSSGKSFLINTVLW